jgi:hypothetical protein
MIERRRPKNKAEREGISAPESSTEIEVVFDKIRRLTLRDIFQQILKARHYGSAGMDACKE